MCTFSSTQEEKTVSSTKGTNDDALVLIMNIWPNHFGDFSPERYRLLKAKSTVSVLVQLREETLIIEYLTNNQHRVCLNSEKLPEHVEVFSCRHQIDIKNITVSLPFTEGQSSKKEDTVESCLFN